MNNMKKFKIKSLSKQIVKIKFFINILFNNFTVYNWIPAFAGMTITGLNGELLFPRRRESSILYCNFKYWSKNNE
jgi:hypothetical protein